MRQFSEIREKEGDESRGFYIGKRKKFKDQEAVN
jgi:hypothetical protein